MRILLDVYLAENFGDDLLVALLCHKFSHHDFFLLADESYSSRFESLENLHFVGALSRDRGFGTRLVDKVRLLLGLPRMTFMKALAIGNFDAYILLGGSLFMEMGTKTQLGREAEIRHASSFIRVSGVLDANFGPYRSAGFLNRHFDLFQRMTFVSFRDKKSRDLFESLPNVSFGADLSFSLSDSNFRGDFIGGRCGDLEQEPIMLVCPVELKNRPGLTEFHSPYMDFFEAKIRSHLAEGGSVVLLPSCLAEGDGVACAALGERLRDCGGRVRYVEARSVNDILCIFASASVVLASRFHAICVGIALNREVIAISYSGKIEEALGDVDIARNCVHVSSLPGRAATKVGSLVRSSRTSELMGTYLEQFERVECALRSSEAR